MNTIIATVSFDYKGKSYVLSALIDVNNIIDHEDFYQSVYLTIAKENNIGLYTYELEIMMDHKINFSDAVGYAKQCINNGELDLYRLRGLRDKYLAQPYVSELIKKYSLENDSQQIVNALSDAYIMGKNSKK